jgi:large subunit ribosomal protein L31
MKKGIHPVYRPVVFQDISSGHAFLTRSTIESKDKVKWEDGHEYALVKVDISASSHPFFTGKQKFLDTTGRLDRFNKKFGGTYSFQKSGKK